MSKSIVVPVNVEGLHGLSSFHRKAVLSARSVGCFHCLRIFSPKLIKHGCDYRGSLHDKNKKVKNNNIVWQTACCPFCMVDAILPSKTYGFIVTKELLVKMHERWFGRRHPTSQT